MGNPNTYRGKTLEWEKGRQLKRFDAVGINLVFNYDGYGRRVGKGNVKYVYDVNGRLIKEYKEGTGGYNLEFIYSGDDIVGFKHNSTDYIYRKNAQGDITHILGIDGTIKVCYTYDAWGNYAVLQNTDNLAEINPFRYRGYYYDTETGFYYLQTRYYDPEIRRFINADNYELLPALASMLGQLNLYSYCGNNPVMYTDSTGQWFLLDDLIAAAVGLISGLVGQLVADLTTSLFTGQWSFSSWETYLGMAVGGAIGGWATLYVGPVAGVAIGSGLGTFLGQGLESLTGTNTRSFGEILFNTLLSAGIGTATAGLTSFIKIPGITSGSHSFTQVWKAGVSKAVNHGFGMALKTVGKGFVSSLVSEFTVGWLLSNLIEGGISAFRFHLGNIGNANRLIPLPY